MGIVLAPKAMPIIVKSERQEPRTQKKAYTNDDLPFESARDLKIWQSSVLPPIICWAGTSDQPFTVNTHENFEDIVAKHWREHFPEVEIIEAVYYVVCVIFVLSLFLPLTFLIYFPG